MHHETHLYTLDVKQFVKLMGVTVKWNSPKNKKSDRFGKSLFIGDDSHKISVLAFHQIKGEKRNLEKQTYQNNINAPPSKIFKEKTSKIDAEVYVSRNRNDCGTSEVQQNIKK